MEEKQLVIKNVVGIPEIAFENVSDVNVISGKFHWLNVYVLDQLRNGNYSCSRKIFVPTLTPVETTFTPFNFGDVVKNIHLLRKSNEPLFLLTYSWSFVGYLHDTFGNDLSYYRLEIHQGKPSAKYYDSEALDGSFEISLEIRF